MKSTGKLLIIIRELYENRRSLLDKQTIGMNFTKFNEEDLLSYNFVFLSNNVANNVPFNTSTNST